MCHLIFVSFLLCFFFLSGCLIVVIKSAPCQPRERTQGTSSTQPDHISRQVLVLYSNSCSFFLMVLQGSVCE